MVSSTRFRGAIRSGPNAATGDVVLMQKATFDVASTTQVELFTLPQGAFIQDVVLFESTSTQTNVTIDMGSSSNPDGIVNEYIVGSDNQDAAANGHNTARQAEVLGADVTSTPLAAATTVYGINGAAAGTGNATVGVVYTIDVDAAREPSAE
jgi:hypothetical protein